jgi:hypothetical protein
MRSRFVVAGLISFVVLGHGPAGASSISVVDVVDPPPNDAQKGVGIGAALLTGGGALIVSLGTFGFGGVLFGAGAAGFQVGAGGAIVAKSVSSATVPDPNFHQPVQVATLTINQLPDSNLVDPSLANPANAAMQDIGTFDANIRAFGIANNRYVSALAAGDAADAQSQLLAASRFFLTAQAGLFAFSNDLSQLDTALDSTPLGELTFDVASLFSSVQSTLLSTGFPPEEQTFISQYQMSSDEQAMFISLISGLTTSDAVGFYGSSVTFRDLLGEIGALSADIAATLPTETNFTPVPEPSTLILFGTGLAVLRGRRRRLRPPTQTWRRRFS